MPYSIYVICSGGTVDQDYGNCAWAQIDDTKQHTLITQLIEQKDEIFLDMNEEIVKKTDDHECSIGLVAEYHYKTKKEASAFKQGFAIAFEDADHDPQKEQLFIHEVKT